MSTKSKESENNLAKDEASAGPSRPQIKRRGANFKRPRPNIGDGSLPKPKALSTTATPLTNDPLWQNAIVCEGERGLSSEESIKVFNADAAGYVYLVEQEYHAISDCDKFVTKTVPLSAYAYYHHILWWYKIALTAQKRGTASDAQNRLVHFVDGYDIKVGSGAATYLSGMGDFTDAAGVKHYMQAREPTDDGHFGVIDERTHRDYETLIAPAITMNRVLSDIAATVNRNDQEFIMPQGVLGRIPRDRPPNPEPVRPRPRRGADIPAMMPDDPDIAEGIEGEPEDHDGFRDVGEPAHEVGHQPTANLLGWRQPVGLNKNQISEMLGIFEDPGDVEYQNDRYRVHRELFEFVYRRIRECQRYKVVNLPKATTGSVAQQLAWRPNNAVLNRNRQFISGEGRVVSRTLLPARIVAMARVLCYRAIRAGFEDDETDEEGERHSWAALHWNRYRNVPNDWQANRNSYLVHGMKGLYEWTPFTTSIENRGDAVVEFLNTFKAK